MALIDSFRKQTLDCSGQLCPIPIIMTEEKMAAMKNGQVLEVIFTDPGAHPDLEVWCLATGNRLLEVKKLKTSGRAYIRKEEGV